MLVQLTYDFPLDENGFKTERYEYEAEQKEVEKAIKEQAKDDYSHMLDSDEVEPFIEAHWDELLEEYRDVVKDLLYDKALAEYKEAKALEKDPYRYYGLNRNE